MIKFIVISTLSITAVLKGYPNHNPPTHVRTGFNLWFWKNVLVHPEAKILL